MKYWFIDQHRSSHGVQKMCLVIGASRSGYYGWKRQQESKRQKDNEKILMEIKESHKNSRRAYGSPRITKDIQARGTKCSENCGGIWFYRWELYHLKDSEADRLDFVDNAKLLTLVSFKKKPVYARSAILH